MLNRKTAPAFQKTNSFTLIKPEKVVLSNGVTILFVNGGEQDVVKIEFIFKAGKWYEGQAGVSYFTTSQLQKGTLTKSSLQISSELDQHGLHLEASPGYDFTSLTLYGLSKNIHKFLELVVEIITQPTFPESELQQAKDIYIQKLKINLEKTSYLASSLLRQNLFGKAHPYGTDASTEQIKSIERTQLSSFHKQFIKTPLIICSGKITEPLKNELATLFSHISQSEDVKHSVTLQEISPSSELLKKSNSVQSSIRLGRRSIHRTHPDYPALLLLNHILGGFFGSRLMKNIREEKGLTYGIYSSISGFIQDSFLSIGADVNIENRDIVIQEIKNECNQLRSHRIGRSEFDTARNHLIGSFQSEITTPFAHADKIKNIVLHELPPNFYQSLLNKIESLDSDDLMETSQRHLNEADFSVVAVG